MPASWSNFVEYSKNVEFNGLCANWFTDFLAGCVNASGSQYSICKNALQTNVLANNPSAITKVFNTQIALYANDKLSQYTSDCYKNYTKKPTSNG